MIGVPSRNSPLNEEFRVKTKIRRQLKTRKQRIARRLEQIDRTASKRPELVATNIGYEIAGRTRAITTGGIGAVHMLVKRLGLDRAINDRLGLPTSAGNRHPCTNVLLAHEHRLD